LFTDARRLQRVGGSNPSERAKNLKITGGRSEKRASERLLERILVFPCEVAPPRALRPGRNASDERRRSKGRIVLFYLMPSLAVQEVPECRAAIDCSRSASASMGALGAARTTPSAAPSTARCALTPYASVAAASQRARAARAVPWA
jgi:hypothetical protein